MKKTAATKFNGLKKNPKSRFYLLLFLFGTFFVNHSNAAMVTNLNDSGTGSLRAVVTAATNGEVITFSPALLSSGSATIVLTSEINISASITINGLINGADTLFISGNNAIGIFSIYVNPTGTSDVYLNNLVLINGRLTGYGEGAAIYCRTGNLVVNNCVFRGNKARNGAAIYYSEGNSFYIHQLTINNCSFYNNTAVDRAAAIYCESSLSTANMVRVTINNSTINNNSAGVGATAVFCGASISSASQPGSVSARIFVNQSTICNNTGPSAVEVIASNSNNSASSSSSNIEINNSTIVNNGTVALRSSANNTNSTYISVTSSIVFGGIYSNSVQKVLSGGSNLFSEATLTGSNSTYDQLGVTATAIALAPLAYNGGPTKTMLPMPGSIAIDNGPSAITVDAQNGPIIGVRDIGAAENRSTYATDVVTNCGPYTWIDGITYNTNNNTATHTLVNSAGNDSIITLNLTINPVYNLNQAVTICPGNNYIFGSQTLTTAGNYVEVFSSIHGCDSTVNLTLSVGDNVGPVPTLATLPVLSNPCSITSLTAPTAMDNCSGLVTGTHNTTLPITTQGTTIVTWTFTDANGNSTTKNQTVYIDDNTAPVKDITSLTPVNSQCAVTSLIAPTATDNCAGTITGTHNATLPITAPGTTMVIWTYNDGHGNTSTQSQQVIINDNTAPMADLALLPDVSGICSVTSLISPTATDNCAGTITGTHNTTLPITAQGTTVVTWTYNDGNGNTSTQTQNVIINDNTAPIANVANLSDVTAQCSVTSLTAPTATDNCAGTITGTHSTTLPITAQGTTVVTWTYDDGNGNISTQTQNVIINDNTAPVANAANLSDITTQCSVTSLTAPTATDNCAGTITGTHNATLPITAQGTTVLTWTYNDGNGNTSTQTQNVIINDNTAPVANVATLSDVTGQCSVTSLTAPTATDNCDGTITGTHNATLPITTPGTTVVTWNYTDGNGNTSTQMQNVIVTLPVATTTLNGITISATTSGAAYQWINCGTGNTPISGATSQAFTATANGTYAVIVTQNGCSDTSACVAISTVGLEDLTTSLFTLYPNPNNGTFKVVTELPISIQITNAAGQLVATQSLESGEIIIELKDVESGVYFVSAIHANGLTSVQRVSVVR